MSMNSFQSAQAAASKDPVSKLVYELSKLPGIGEKTATRLAYHILKQGPEYAHALADALIQAKTKTALCTTCFTLTDQNPCRICTDVTRNAEIFCVVERPTDILPIEQTGNYRGLYHVLHGTLSPLDGIGPDELKIRELLARLTPTVREVILATNPSVEGEATALYLSRLIKPLGMKVSQLAYGIPVGGLLEYTDRQTLNRAFENRAPVK